MDISSYIAFGAALVSALLTFVSLLISKDNKTSEFRQSWIDGMRQDLSIFIGDVSHLGAMWILIRDTSEDEEAFQRRHQIFITEQADRLANVVSLRSRILLRINRDEHANFVERLEATYGMITDGIPDDIVEVRLAISQLTACSQNLLRKEWARVKRGESSFWITRSIAMGIVIFIAIAFVFHFFYAEYVLGSY